MERQLFEINDNTIVDYPKDKTIIDLFEEQAATKPNNIALVFEREELTYKELNELSNQLAHYLRSRGVKEDTLVPICIERSIEMLTGILGILKAGGAYVPVDPDYPAGRIGYMLKDTAAKIVLCSTETRSKLPCTENIDVIEIDGDWPAISKEPVNNLQTNVRPHNLAYVIYTSGSTGKPKGVLIEHRNVVRLFINSTPIYDFTEKDVWCMFHSFSFDFSVWEMYGALFYGGRLVIVPKHVTKDLTLFAALLVEEQVTILNQTPSAFYVLQDILTDKAKAVTIRYVIFGGEALNPAKLKPWKKLYPGSRLINMYGITETTVHVTYQEIGWQHMAGGKSMIGKPIPTVTTYILDSHQKPVTAGVAGELYIGGAGLGRGYLNRPELTAERFINDPFSKEPGARLYRSGDLGVWLPDGSIEYLGRIDEQVKIHGYRIELGEIENVLQDCDAVHQAVVLAKDDKEGDKRLAGYIVPKGSFDLEGIVNCIKGKLPAYMLPSLWVEMQSLPLTVNGKIDRKALPDPDISGSIVNNYVKPGNEMEKALVEIWQDLLGVKRVGINDNFFELGGHSLLAQKIVGTLKNKFNYILPVSKFYQLLTVSAIVKFLQQENSKQVKFQPANPYHSSPGGNEANLDTSIPGTIKNDHDNSIRERDIERIIGCTEPQAEILTSCLLGGNEANLAFNESITLKFSGLLDRGAMEHALQKLIARHQSLRSVFNIQDIRLCILKNPTIKLDYRDITVEEDFKKQRIVKEYIHQDSVHLFDLENGPLFKAGLIKLNEGEHYFIFTAHHIICDGWSLGIILQDLGRLYSACVQNIVIDLPEPVLFSQFALEQIKLSESKEYEETEKFWLDQYSGHIPVLNLPTDFTRPQLRTYKSRRLDYKLDTNLVAAIKNIGTKSGCSLVITLLSAFETFLYRLTGQEDIVTGLAASGQSATANYHLVGHCVNLLPLRSNPTPGISFRDYLEKRKPAIFAAYEHQQLTFGSLLNKLKIPRDASRIPLVPVVINIDMGLDDGDTFYGLQYQFTYNPKAYGNFELFLNISGSGNKLTLQWLYNTQLFKAETIDRMMTGFKNLLKTIVTDPTTSLNDITLTEKKEVNGTGFQYQGTQPLNSLTDSDLEDPETNTFFSKELDDTGADNRCIIDLFEEQAAAVPAKTAVVFEQVEVSYMELNERSNQLARYLKRKGVKEETLVPIFIERGIEMMLGILGILKAGCAYVPIDPGYPGERISFMLQDIEAKIVISSKESRQKLPVNNTIDIIEIDSDWPLISKEPVSNLQINSKPGSLAYVIYTSGSTGKPKGVMVTQNNVVSLVKGVDYVSLTGKDILLSTASSSFDATTFDYWGMLLNGGRLVLCTEKRLLDTRLLKEEINKRGVNLVFFTTGWFNQLVEADITLFEKLETILVGGEKLSEQHIEKLRKTYPSIEIISMYGPTENTTFSLSYRITEKKINKPIPIGRPLNNRSAYILDENLKQVKAGTSGEICLSGAGVSRGYLNRRDLTAEKFMKDPFSSQQGSMMYKSGDYGRWLPDGNIEFLGRMDDQVKIRGYRVELGEIEYVLRQGDLVADTVVLVKEDNTGSKRLVGYAVPAKKFNKEEIISYLRGRLPEYMVPYIWVELERLPLTSNGKIDKKALPEPSYNPEWKDQDSKLYSANEKLVKEIWTGLLNIRNISVTDNFFEIGGNSLIAIAVMSRIEKQTGKKLPISSLFQYSTISKLASILDNPTHIDTWKSLVPIKPSGNKDPLYIIHGFGLDVMVFYDIARYMDEDQPVYGIKAKGKDGDEESLDVLEEMASFYISEIIQHNPAGPYAFIGFSAGAVIAFEMAKQLSAMNKEIKLIGVVDYDINTFLSKKLKKNSVEFFPRLFHVLKSFIQHPKKAFEFQVMSLKLRYIKMLARLGYDPKNETEKAMDKFEIALRNYVAKPVDIRIDLFSTKIKVYYLKDAKFMGWEPYALKGIKVHKVPGDHFDTLLSPNSKEFARVLQHALDNR